MKQTWRRWRDVAYRLLGWFVSFGGLLAISLPYMLDADAIPAWSIVVGVVSFIALIVVVILELRSVSDHHVYDIPDRKGIRRYMLHWIRHGGRVAIGTRDMSWANDEQAIALLEEKARAGELVVCVPRTGPLTERLEEQGAEICTYGDVPGVPAARFTITFLNRDGSQVAVGRTVRDEHVIDKFDSRSDPVFYIAQDLVNLARRMRDVG